MNPQVYTTNDLIRGAELIVGDRQASDKAARIAKRKAERDAQAAAFVQAQEALGSEGTPAYMDDRDLLSVAEVDPRGEMQDDFQIITEADRGYTTDPETGQVREETYLERTGDPVKMAPTSALQDAYNRLQQGTQQFGYGAFPGSADVAGRLEGYITPNIELEAEAALASELAQRDRATQNPLRQAYSDVAAQIEAEQLLRGNLAQGGMTELERMGIIAKLGNSGSLKGSEETSMIVDPPMKGYAATELIPGQTIYTDPRTGAPIAAQGPELPPHLLMQATSPNNMGSHDQLNAPMSAQDWVLARQPNFRSGKSSNIGDYPQVDITLETTNFANKVKELGQAKGYENLANVSKNVRSIADLQAVVDAIVQGAPERGIKLRTRPETEDGPQPKPSVNPGTAEVANLLLRTKGDESRLANALFQLEVAKQRGLNQPYGEAYRSRKPLQGPMPIDQLTRKVMEGMPTSATNPIAFDSPEVFDNSQMMSRLAPMPKSKIRMRAPLADRPMGTPLDRSQLIDRDIKAELRARGDNEQAIAAVLGEQVQTGRGMYSGRDEIATREDRMSQILENQAKREAKDRRMNPMRIRRKPTREDDTFTKNIADLRDIQVRTYVARKRAEEATRKRTEQMDAVISSLPPTALRSVFPRGSR